tara:strand:- start:1625 stop:2803 length:1179 start_codon:yes stop_codon:yes gene_type:complete
MSILYVDTIQSLTGANPVTLNDDVVITGVTTLSGNVLVGNASADSITFNSRIATSMVPKTNNTHDLGSPSLKWQNLYVSTLSVPAISNVSGSVSISGSGDASCGTTNSAIQMTGSTYIKGCLYVSGTVETVDSLTIGGNLVVNGTTTTMNSTTITIDDPIITLGGDTAPGSDDGKDRGVEFRYYDGSAKVGFFGFDNSTGYLTYIPNATNSSEVFAGGVGYLDIAGIKTTGSQDIVLQSRGGDINFLNAVGSTAMHFDVLNKRLGINKTSPTYTLEVEGPAWINSTVYINGHDLMLDTNNSSSISADNSTYAVEVKVGGTNRAEFTTTAFGPMSGSSYDLGSSAYPWANLYTNDLHLKNDRGDWTIIEEDEYLSIRNNKNGKMFKIVMEEIE